MCTCFLCQCKATIKCYQIRKELLFLFLISVTTHDVKQWRNLGFKKIKSGQSTSLHAITPLVCMHFAQFKAYSECNSCTLRLSAITATAPLWATIQTTALAKVLSKSLSCRVGNKVAGVQSADVEGGDQQVDKWGQAVLQTGTNTAYSVYPCASPYNPRASTCSLADMTPCPNMLRAKVLLLPQVPCPSPRLFQLTSPRDDLCFLLAQHQWMNWAKAKMVPSAQNGSLSVPVKGTLESTQLLLLQGAWSRVQQIL